MSDYLPAESVQRAMLLIGAVHECGPDEVDQVLRRLDTPALHGLAVTLAAMVPDGFTPAELLAWNDCQYAQKPLPPQDPALFRVRGEIELRPHGTHAAFNRHKNAGEEPCDACRHGEREYQRERARTVRRRARAASIREAVEELAS